MLLVVNSDARLRQLAESAMGAYPLHRGLGLRNVQDFSSSVSSHAPEVVLVHLDAASLSKIRRLLGRIQREWPETQVELLSHSDAFHLRVEAIEERGYEFLPQSIGWRQLGWVLQAALWK